MSGSAFAVTHHAFSSGAGRTSDGNGSHASTLKSPSYTKSVSWQHYPAWIIEELRKIIASQDKVAAVAALDVLHRMSKELFNTELILNPGGHNELHIPD